MNPVALDRWRLLGAGGRGPKVSADLRPEPLPAHMGAWLDRYLVEDPSQDEKPGRTALLTTAIESLRPAAGGPAVLGWRAGYARWLSWVEGEELGVLRRGVRLQATSRILLHVGAGSSVTDGSILLHHTWGVPYLPGSALKGIVRSALSAGFRNRVTAGAEVVAELLGAGPDSGLAERAALVDFLDAPWIPEAPSDGDADWSPLALDVVTPHHSAYYTRTDGKPYPTDFDEPVPTQRLSIAPGTRFHVVAEASRGLPARWLDFIVGDVLVPALAEDGIGAWTTSGYGRLKCRS